MKYAFLLLFLGFTNLFAQSPASDSTQNNSEEIYTVVEVMPSPRGGMEELYKWIAKTVKYPASARRMGVEGTAFVGFIVHKDGSISDIKIVQHVDPAIDRESERVIGLMQNWNPGRQNGKAVNVRYVLPIKFKLAGTSPASNSNVIVAFLPSTDNNPPSDAADSIFIVPEVMPEYPGGLEPLYKLIANDLKYPSDARVNGVEGTVYVEFIVTWQGNVKNVRTLHGASPSMNAEAERVIRLAASSAKWQPGQLNGKPINSKFVLPVKFKITGSERWALYESVSEMPTYPGGDEAMQKRIKKHLTYPVNAKRHGITGTVVVEFVVERNGSLSEVRTLQGVTPDLNAEAERVVRLFPKLNPGKQDGVPVRVVMVVPIAFKLDQQIPPTASIDSQAQANSTPEKESIVDKDTVVYAVAEVMPEYAEGNEAMYKFIAANIEYPDEARRYGHEGTVYVGFVVTKNGAMRDVQIVKGVTDGVNAEAARVVGLLSSWKPGMQSGKPVNVKFVLPIKFKLSAEQKTTESLTSLIKSDFTSDTIYAKVDSMPRYPGGLDAFYKLMLEQVKYPLDARRMGIEGTVYVGFVVTKHGELKAIRVVRGVSASIDAETESVVALAGSTLPWEPGKLDGKPVNVKYELSLRFKLAANVNDDSVRTVSAGGVVVKKREITGDAVGPTPKWGMDEVYGFLAKKMQYPEEARKKGIEGDVYVEFIINTDGRISDAKTIRGVSPELDAEAERLIGLMRPWLPARINGKAVKVKHVMGIRFKL